MIGKTLGHYEITGMLGKGGMGEVYRGRDARLDRDVALKLLPADVADEGERLARFRREAKLLAALNHPNVASLYGFEETAEHRFLVMEVVEGDDLADIMRSGPIPETRAVEIALQIAEGLAAAHARGIVHRDLKPQNVKLDPEGRVKILDFGLATADATADPEQDPSQSPTITAALTQAGTLMGTAGYMSPEQATARPVDARADVWAFGVILFEMLSGKQLFAAENVGETLAAVIRAEPEWDDLPATTHPALRRLLRRCLRKKASQRLHSIADARLELEELDDLAPAEADSAAGRQSLLRPHPIWIVPLLLGALITFALTRSTGPENTQAPRVVRSSVPLAENTRLAGWASPVLALSPDGSTLAFVASDERGQRLYVRPLNAESPTEVPDSDGAEGPFFSPDGRWVGFGAGSISGRSREPRRLKKYNLVTGQTSEISEIGDYFGGTWASDGTIYFANVHPQGLWRVSSGGGTPVQLDLDSKLGLSWPQILPDETKTLSIEFHPPAGLLHITDLTDGSTRPMGIECVFARWSPSGHLLVVDGESRVWVHRFDLKTYAVDPERSLLFEDVSLTGNLAAALALSNEGMLAFTRGPVAGSRRDLAEPVRVEADGTRTSLGVEAGGYGRMAISPDGTRLALERDAREIWIADLNRGTTLRLPSGDVTDRRYPLWTPDGDAIVFSGPPPSAPATVSLYVQSAGGVDAPVSIDDRYGEFFAGSWVPGTRKLVHFGYETAELVDTAIYLIDIDQPEEIETLIQDDGQQDRPAISPNGRWMAYRSSEDGAQLVFLRSFPDLRTKIPIGEGSNPQWSAESERLFHLRWIERDGRNVTTVAVREIGPAGEVGPPTTVFELGDEAGWTYDPKNDRHYVLRRIPGVGEVTSIELIQNFDRELESLLSAE